MLRDAEREMSEREEGRGVLSFFVVFVADSFSFSLFFLLFSLFFFFFFSFSFFSLFALMSLCFLSIGVSKK